MGSQAFDLDAAETKPFDLDSAEGAPPKPPTTKADYLKLANSLPKGSKEREDAINMATRMSEPEAAGTALGLTSALPLGAMGLPRAALSLVGAGVGGHAGRYIGSGLPIPHAGTIGQVIGSLVGGGIGGIRGVEGVQTVADTMPGYAGRLAKGALKLFGIGEKGKASAEAAPAIDELVADLRKAGFDPANAEKVAANIRAKGLTPMATSGAVPAGPPSMPSTTLPKPSPVSSTLPGPPPAPPTTGPPEPPSAALSSAAGEMPGTNPGADPTKILTDQIKAQLDKGDYKDLQALDEMIEKSSGEFRKTLRQIRQQHMATRGVRHGDFHIKAEPEE